MYVILKLKSQLSSLCIAYYWLCLLVLATYLVDMQVFFPLYSAQWRNPTFKRTRLPSWSAANFFIT